MIKHYLTLPSELTNHSVTVVREFLPLYVAGAQPRPIFTARALYSVPHLVHVKYSNCSCDDLYMLSTRAHIMSL